MMSPGALVPVTEYVTCRGPAGVVLVVVGGGDDVVVAGGGAAVVVGAGGGGGGVTVTVWVSVALGVSVGGGGGGGGGGGAVVVVISSCIGGVDGVVVGPGLASLLVSFRVTSSDTETTSAIAATMAAMPTTHGQRGAPCSSSESEESS